MANFAYVARSQAGEETTGFVAGNSQDDVVNTLHRQGMVVLHIVESRARGGSGRGGLTAFLLRGTVGARDLALFSSQFSTVIEAGIPMVRGLRGLAADMHNRTLSRALFDVSRRVETGEGLGDAMARHPHAFNKMYVNMVRAGERAGTLPACSCCWRSCRPSRRSTPTWGRTCRRSPARSSRPRPSCATTRR
jgi:type II secretory pathway component PulF